MTDLEGRAEKFYMDFLESGMGYSPKHIKSLLITFAQQETKLLADEVNGWKTKFEKLERKCRFNFVDLLEDVEKENKQDKKLAETRKIIGEFVKWANWRGANCPSFRSIQDKAEAFLKE